MLERVLINSEFFILSASAAIASLLIRDSYERLDPSLPVEQSLKAYKEEWVSLYYLCNHVENYLLDNFWIINSLIGINQPLH